MTAKRDCINKTIQELLIFYILMETLRKYAKVVSALLSWYQDIVIYNKIAVLH